MDSARIDMRKIPGPLVEKLHFFPPFLCYYLARRPGYSNKAMSKRYTIAELAERSGISERTFSRIASKLTWDGIGVDLCSAFLHACHVNPFKHSEQKNYIRKTMRMKRRFSHLLPSQRADLDVKFARLELMRASE